MRLVEQSPTLAIWHQSPWGARGMGLAFAAIGAGTIVLTRSQHGALLIPSIIGAVFMIIGAVLFVVADDDRIVIDTSARVARIIQRTLVKSSTTEIPFTTIRDVALERSVNQSSRSTSVTYRPIFICTDDRRVPWSAISTSDRTAQAECVAAARALGGWNALPTESPPPLPAVVKNAGCLLGFALLFVAFGLLMVAMQTVPLLTYKPVPATVLSSDVTTVHGTRGGVSYTPAVTYRYQVNGQEYTSARVAPLTVSAGYTWAKSVSNRYEPGAEITAWVDPGNPSKAFVEHRFSMIPVLMILIMILIYGMFQFLTKWQRGVQAGSSDVPVVDSLPLQMRIAR